MLKKEPVKSKFFSSFCLGVLIFCLLIILWGAWVRISHSGDACGSSWPSCNGQYLIDSGADIKLQTEWFHRATSGLFGILVLILCGFAFSLFPKSHPVRKISLFILFFSITEALIGAGLVLFSLTGADDSFNRVLVMNLHLTNSILLMGSLILCWRTSLGKHFSFSHRKYLLSFIFVFFLIAFFGSLSALSSSLFPSSSLWQGLALDLDPHSHWMIKLRILHPFFALLFGGAFLFYYLRLLFKQAQTKKMDAQLIFFTSCLALVLLSGFITFLFLSPTFLKLFHLLMLYLMELSFLLALEKEPFIIYKIDEKISQ